MLSGEIGNHSRLLPLAVKLRPFPLSESQMSALENEEDDGGHHVQDGGGHLRR